MARHDDIAIFYDNSDYMQKVRHQIVSDHGVMYNYTTAKLVRGGIRIPEGGLLQSMLNRELPIRYDEDILWSTDIDSDGLWKDIQKCLILTAINGVYPTAVAMRRSIVARKTDVHRCRSSISSHALKPSMSRWVPFWRMKPR
jgi:hypothetical protein